LVSATLLALALPPYCPWWLTVSAAAFAMLFVGMHCERGLRERHQHCSACRRTQHRETS